MYQQSANQSRLKVILGMVVPPLIFKKFPRISVRIKHFWLIADVRRRFWLGVLVTCFALTLAQTHNRLVQYVSIPISTTVRYLRNDSLLFPSVTLCPYRDSL